MDSHETDRLLARMDSHDTDRLLAALADIREALDRVAAELGAIRLHQEGLAVKPHEPEMSEG